MGFSSEYWHYFNCSDSRGYLSFCCHGVPRNKQILIDCSAAFLMFQEAFGLILLWRKTAIHYLSMPLCQRVAFIVCQRRRGIYFCCTLLKLISSNYNFSLESVEKSVSKDRYSSLSNHNLLDVSKCSL